MEVSLFYYYPAEVHCLCLICESSAYSIQCTMVGGQICYHKAAVCGTSCASCYLKLLQCSIISLRYSFPGKASLDLLIIGEHAHQATYTPVLAISVHVSMKDRRQRVANTGQSPSLGSLQVGTHLRRIDRHRNSLPSNPVALRSLLIAVVALPSGLQWQAESCKCQQRRSHYLAGRLKTVLT